MADAKESKEGEAKPKKGKKGLILIIAAVLLLVGGGGAAWFFLKGKGDGEDAGAHAEEARKKEQKKARVFLPLEQFTVNLADEGDRFAQVAVILEITNNNIAEEIKTEMPAVRNKILLLLSSKQSKELLTLEGKEKLARQIAEVTSRTIGWEPPVKKKPKKKKKKAVEDEDPEEEAPPEEEEAKPSRAAREDSVALPVEAVHFSQFIVQ